MNQSTASAAAAATTTKLYYYALDDLSSKCLQLKILLL